MNAPGAILRGLAGRNAEGVFQPVRGRDFFWVFAVDERHWPSTLQLVLIPRAQRESTMTHNPQPTTHNPQPTTHNPQP